MTGLLKKGLIIFYCLLVPYKTRSLLGRIIILAALFLSIGNGVWGQTNTYTGGNNGSWNTAGNWSLGIVPSAAHNVVISDVGGNDRTVVINANAVCNSLTLNQGARNITLNVNGYTLAVTNGITMNAPTGGTRNTLLNIGSGTVNCQTISSNNSGNDSRDNKIAISTGTLNVTGNIAMGNNASRNDITFSGAGTINVGGNLTTGTLVGNAGTINIGGTFSPSTFTQNNSTVNYNRAGNQNISTYTYYNLTISGSGNKTSASTAFTVTNNLTITSGNLVLQATNNHYDIGNNLTVNAGATLTHSVNWDTYGRQINVGGNLSILGTYNYPVARAHISMTGTGTRDINTGTAELSILTLQNGNFRATGPVTVNDNFWAMFGTGGSFSTNGQTVTAKAAVLINGGTVNINGGTLNVTGGVSVGTGGSLNGAVNMSSGTLNTDNILIYPLSTYTCTGSPQINITGNFTNNGTFTRATGTVTFNGTSLQTLGGSTNTNFNNLTVNNAAGVTLSNGITITSTLNLANGNLSLGSGTNNLTIETAGNITGTFDNTHMIVCDGNGSLIKQSTNTAGLVRVYPVGTGSYYTPFEITALTAGGSGTRSVSVRAVTGAAPGPPPVNSTDLQKYWVIATQNVTVTSANLSFTYNPGEVGTGGDQSTYQPYLYSGGAWNLAAGASSGGTNPMTVTGATAIAGTWTGREGPKTYYSYQSGPWATATTWTTDPSGTLSVDPGVPGSMDRVVILNGRTVTTAAGHTVLSLQINEGGTLDIGNTTGHNFGDVRGQGLLRLNTVTFPTGNFTSFVAANGGTVEYYNVGGTLQQLEYNNLILQKTNNNTASYNIILAGNLTINGNFTLNRTQDSGTMTFTIGDNTTARNITVRGNITVGAGCNIATGTSNAFHTLEIYGDFTNNGTVRFTNRTAPVTYTYMTSDPPNGVVVNFRGLTDNTLTCNGTTDFHRLIVDKGSDQTYILTVNSANDQYFRIFGRNNQEATDYAGNPNNPNLQGVLKNTWIKNGTLRLEGNIYIPSLTEGGGDNYHLPLNGCLWLNGANVRVDVTMTDGGGGNQTLVPFGKLRVDAGNLDFMNAAGLVYRGTSEIEFNGGTIRASQFRGSSVTAEALTSFVMTGGVFTIDGQGENNNDKPSFGLPFLTNTFVMTGGVININYAVQNGANGGAIVIGCSPENINVTGGQININITNNSAYRVNSTAPFYNLSIGKTGGTATSVSIESVTSAGFASGSYTTPQMPLRVLNNLTIVSGNTPTLITNNADVYVGGNFTVNPNTTYTPGNNNTVFNGISGQIFANNGTITNGLYNLVISNRSNTSITQNLTVRNNLSIESSCFLQDMGYRISVAGNVSNSGTHTSQAIGSITLGSTVDQSIDGDGNGIFGNLIINKNTGLASFTANQSLTGNLRLANGILNIGTYGLSLGLGSNVYSTDNTIATAFSGTKMIRTAGNMSDGGITKEYNSTTAFLFPIGTANDYTPATIQFTSAPAAWGSVNVKPVAQANPFVTSTNSLSYYWKVTQTGFSGIAANSVHHTYRYVNSDIRGTEANYIPGVYNSFAWVYINDVSQVVDNDNEIRFWNVGYINGDFTAGYPAAFEPVKVFYSRQNGNWNNTNTWSSVAVGGVVDGLLPGNNNPVVIGDGTINHTVTIPATYNNVSVGGLQINSGSVLDITTSTGHNFGAIPDSKVSGTGTLRISAAAPATIAEFPSGDFGNFLSAGGGTVEYYSTGTRDFTIPNTKTYYNNLILSPEAGRYISMPNIDLIVFGNYNISGTGTGVARLNATPARTLTVNGNINITGGTLQYYNGTSQTIYANSDINISNGAFNVRNEGTAVANLLYISGNLNNNGTFNMLNGTRYCNVYFTGNSNKVISGSGNNTFNFLYVDKGNSRDIILDVTTNNLTLSGTAGTITGSALKLNNGTFRVSNSSLSFTLATTSSFTIPISAALSVNEGTVNIGTTNNDGDLILAGRLEIINNGTVNIGNGGNYSNDIEYASGGNPEIIVTGNGVLNVNGQIRRPTSITTGSLSYTQGGTSTVMIAGRQAVNTRGMLEVLNSGSSFTMSGGTLTIMRNFNNASYNELYLTPEASNVTGGTIRLGSSAAANNSAFNFVSSAPLWNLVIDASTTTKTVNQRIYPLTVLNNLVIEGHSTYSANGLNVVIRGSLINNNSNPGIGTGIGGYQPGSLTQVTTFNGTGAQYITGAGSNLTNFANLVIAGNSVNLSSNSNIRVNSNLTLQSGSFNDGSNNVTVLGNIRNSATHISPSATGGIIIAGPDKQTISGSGSGVFGNIAIENSLGVDMKDNSTINGDLEFINGFLYIDDYLLTLSTGATISGTTDNDRMIVSNGVLSDAGVRKIFNSGTGSFTFPIGVAGKFTPVSYNFASNSNSNASITIKPVNADHPFLFNTDGDELEYYWNVVSSGFTSGYTVSHTYNYSNSDVSGNENNYVGGRFISGSWTPEGGIPGAVDAVNNRISLAGVSYLDGEYTAGVTANFSNKPVLYSRQTGNWFSTNTWSTTPGGSSCNCTPNGNPVVIATGHTITLGSNGAVAYSVDIQGTLDAGNTVFHSLGHVSGSGTIRLTATGDGMFAFPGGYFDAFMANSSSTINFFSTNNATLPLKPGNNYKPYQNVFFTGAGIKYISAEDLKVMGNLTIEAGATLNNTLFNRKITILGNWTDNNTSANGGFVPGTGTVSFNGIAAQTLTVTGASTTEQFYNLQVNNPAGVTIAGGGQVAVSNNLYLTSGNIATSATNLLSITNSSPSAVIGGGSSSFVNGPLQKRINAGSYFNFPVGNGNGTRFGNLYISSVSTTSNYQAQYYNHNPADDGRNPSSVVAPVDAVSNVEYWRLNGPAGATANVRVRWDTQSGIIPPDAASRSKLRIVEWNGTAWQNRGNVINDEGQSSGTVQTSPAVSVAGNHYFTIGAESLPTVDITSGNASFCNDGTATATITVELTGTAPWTIRYKVNGTNETTISNIATSPFNIVIGSSSPGITGPGAYVYNMSYVRDATGATGIRYFDKTVTITVNEQPNPVITGNQTVGIGETGVVYSSGTGNIPEHTYLWTVSNGTITSGQGTYRITVNWSSSFGTGWVRLQETATTGGCSVTTDNYLVAITDIPNPDVTGPDPVCLNGIYTYSTPSVGTHTYSWSLPSGGGIITGPSTSNSVMVEWRSTGNFVIRVTETGSASRTDELEVTVNPVPASNNTVSDPTICAGGMASIQIAGTAPGLAYQLRLNSDNSPVGLPVLSGPGGTITINVSTAATTTYNIIATNEYTCSAQLTDLSTVTVNPLPVVTITGPVSECEEATIELDTGPGFASYAWSIGATPLGTERTQQVTTQSLHAPVNSVTETYTVVVTNAQGCQGTDSHSITVYRLPDTGPAYHIPNDHGE